MCRSFGGAKSLLRPTTCLDTTSSGKCASWSQIILLGYWPTLKGPTPRWGAAWTPLAHGSGEEVGLAKCWQVGASGGGGSAGDPREGTGNMGLPKNWKPSACQGPDLGGIRCSTPRNTSGRSRAELGPSSTTLAEAGQSLAKSANLAHTLARSGRPRAHLEVLGPHVAEKGQVWSSSGQM